MRPGSDGHASPGNGLVDLKKQIAKNYGWSLYEIDEADFFNLLDFIFAAEPEDQNTRVIGGQIYHRAAPEKAPGWL